MSTHTKYLESNDFNTSTYSLTLFGIKDINGIIANYAKEDTWLMNRSGDRYIELLFPNEQEKRFIREEKEKMLLPEESRKWYYLSRNPSFFGNNKIDIKTVLNLM
jgi:hypothetical protein